MKNRFVMTYTGKDILLEKITADDVDIFDIAHSLSNQCRYNGHVKFFYSVAQHCVLMSHIKFVECPLAALLHDAAETYIGDITTPVKNMIRLSSPQFSAIESRINRAIEEKFNLKSGDLNSENIHRADITMLATEYRDIVNQNGAPWKIRAKPLRDKIMPLWTPDLIRTFFLKRFAEIK